MKRILFLCIVLVCALQSSAQQFGLFGTGTMFDGFENVSQKSFILDHSREFSSNFFLPYFGVNAANRGPADDVVRNLLQGGEIDTRNLTLGTGKNNHLYENSNVYVAGLRIFKSYKHQKEMGFAWQVRSDVVFNYTNETLAIFDSYLKFPRGERLRDIFNSDGYQQSYHQFSFSYRENYDKRLAFGVKASLLSGILYNSLDINNSDLLINGTASRLEFGFDGKYRRNFEQFADIKKNNFAPTFKNPGLSLSFGTNYTTKDGLFLMGNLKDLGFIWWRSGTQESNLSGRNSISGLPSNQGRINERIQNIFINSGESKKFLAATNAKADFYISKTFGFYKPAVVVSKNLFYRGGDIALVNTFNYLDLSASVIPNYNFNNIFMVGLQGKYQTPNFELFMGTDNFLGSAYTAKGLIKQNGSIGAGRKGIGASVYFGIGFKIGNVVNHPLNADIIPGINDNENSFFKDLFSVFKKG